MLLDTSFLIDLMRGDEGAVERARQLEADLVQQRLAAMTLFELYYGVARSDQPAAERERRDGRPTPRPHIANLYPTPTAPATWTSCGSPC